MIFQTFIKFNYSMKVKNNQECLEALEKVFSSIILEKKFWKRTVWVFINLEKQKF
jgi:hypothetical protein